MSKKKKFLGLFAILFVAIFAVGCVFATACGKKNKEESEPEHVHEYTVLNQGDADGHYYTCPDDGEKGEVTAHTYGAWTTTQEADCGNYGTQTRTCSVCGYVDTDTTTLSPTGNHTYTATSTVTWNWTWDETQGYTAVTATVTCDVCKQTTTVDGEITTTPQDDIYGEYEATAQIGGQTYTDKETASEFPYDPDELVYNMSLDFSDPATYGWMVEGLVAQPDDDGNDVYTLTQGASYKSDIVTYTVNSSSNTTINKEGAGALYTAGTGANFKINLAGLEGDYITISAKFSANGHDSDRYMYVSTTEKSTDAIYTSAASATETDYQYLDYGQEITATDTALYLVWSANIRIFELEINIYGEAEPDLSGDTGESGNEGGEAIDETLFTVSAEQTVALTSASDSATVAVSVTYDTRDFAEYTGGELEDYAVYIYSSNEGIASVTKTVENGYITVSAAAISGTATVTVAVVKASDYSTEVASASIAVTVTGVGPDDKTEMESTTITFDDLYTASQGTIDADTELCSDIDGLSVVVTPKGSLGGNNEVVVSSHTKPDPEYANRTYAYRLQLNGSGTAEGRSIVFTTEGKAVIRFAMYSGSSSAIRSAKFVQVADDGTETILYTNDGIRGFGDLVIWTVYAPEAGTYYFASTESGLNIYAIDILYTPAVEEDENASGYDTPAVADASVGPIGSWSATAYFDLTYSVIILGEQTRTVMADVSIVVTEDQFTLNIPEFEDVDGAVADILNSVTGGIYFTANYNGSNGTYYIVYEDDDIGEINITALVGQDEKGDYLSVSFTLEFSLGSLGDVVIDVEDQRVRRSVEHEHSYNTTAGYDDECHWTGTCTCGGKTGFAAHEYTWSGSTATCTQAGTETGTCSCGHTTTRDAAATGHTYPAADSESITWDWANRANGQVSVSFTCEACQQSVATTATYTYENGCLVATATFDGNESVEYEGSYELSSVGTALDLAEAIANGVSEITVTADVTVEETLTIAAGSEVTITIAEGVTVTNGTDGVSVISVEEDATLTITGGGTISYTGTDGNTSSASTAAVYSKGDLVLEGVGISSDSIGVKAEGGTVTINDGTTIESVYFALWLGGGTVNAVINGGTISGTNKGIVLCGDGDFGYGSQNYQDGAVQTLTVNGGTLTCKNDSVITTLGVTNSYSSVINIYGGELIGADVSDGATGTPFPTIYIASGTLNIYGGEIEGSTPVEVRGGTTNICGGTLTCTAQATSSASNNSSGATSYGYALSVFPYGTGVAFSGEESTAVDNAVTVYVTGGTFIGGIYASSEADYEGAKYSWAAYTFEISGGYFEKDPSEYVDTDVYNVVTVDDGELAGYYKVLSIDGLWGGDAEFTVSSDLLFILGVSGTSVTLYANAEIEVSGGNFSLTLDSISAPEGDSSASTVAGLLNLMLNEYGIYLVAEYTGDENEYTVEIDDEDFGEFTVTATLGCDEEGDYISISFEMSLDIGVTISIEVSNAKVRRAED